MQAQKVKDEELLEVINAIYHINEAVKVVMSYDDEAYEYLTKARESLIYYYFYYTHSSESFLNSFSQCV
jgi:hypothetical protein